MAIKFSALGQVYWIGTTIENEVSEVASRRCLPHRQVRGKLPWTSHYAAMSWIRTGNPQVSRCIPLRGLLKWSRNVHCSSMKM